MDIKKIVKDIHELAETPREKCPYCDKRVIQVDWESRTASCLIARHLEKWHWTHGCASREKRLKQMGCPKWKKPFMGLGSWECHYSTGHTYDY